MNKKKKNVNDALALWSLKWQRPRRLQVSAPPQKARKIKNVRVAFIPSSC